MKSNAEKRESYSFFDFPSLLQRKRVRLDSRAIERALIELETTPGVTRWRQVDIAVPFISQGREHEAKLQLAVSRRNAPRQHVQIVRGTGGQLEAQSIAAAREHCTRTHYEHVVLAEHHAQRGFWEMQNRLAAHAWLVQAEKWDTTNLENDAPALLASRALRFTELARELKVTPLQAKLVFLRCWLKGVVAWDITAKPLGQDLLVGGPHG